MSRTQGILYLSHDRIALGQLRAKNRKTWLLIDAAIEHFPSLKGEAKLDFEALAQAVSTLAQRHRLPRSLSLILPASWVLTRLLSIPVIDPKRQADALAFETAQAIPYPLQTSAWDHCLIANDGIEQHYLIAAAPLKRLKMLYQMLRASGIQITAFLPSSILDYKLIQGLLPDLPNPVLIIHFKHDAVRLTGRSAQSIAMHRLTITPPSDGKKHNNRLIARQIHAEAQRLQTMTSPETELAAWQKVILINPTADIEQPLLDHLGPVPIEVCQTLEHTQFGKRVDPAIAQARDFPLADLIGAAERKKSKVALGLNLLTTAIQTKRHFKPIWLLAAAALWTIAAGLSVVQRQDTLNALQNQTQLWNSNTATLQTRHDAISKQQAELSKIKSKLEPIHDLADTQYAWIDFLNEVQDHLHQIGEAWLDKLQIIYPKTAETPLQCYLSGRMIDRKKPLRPANSDMERKGHQLIASLSQSPFIDKIELPKVHTTSEGILLFELRVTPNQEKFRFNAAQLMTQMHPLYP